MNDKLKARVEKMRFKPWPGNSDHPCYHDGSRDMHKVLWPEIERLREELEYYASGKALRISGEIDTGSAKEALMRSVEIVGN
jgi:hypothetical protein